MSSERVLASPPGECCTKTVQHAGEAVGVWEQISSTKTYVSYPQKKSDTYDRVILYFADVFGPEYINNQLIMDWFASKGYLVVSPDYMEGGIAFHHLDRLQRPDFDIAAWVTEWIMPKRVRANDLVPSWLEAAKAKYGNESTKYFAVGYCFCAPDVLKLCATGWLAAAALSHPSFLNDEYLENVKEPLIISCVEHDVAFPTESRRKAEDILANIKAEYHIRVFAKVEHGFAVKCDLDVSHEKWAKEQSAMSTIHWFDRFSQ